MIQYRYAINTKRKIINVETLDRKKGIDKYHCIGCGNELIPRLGEIRRKHFAHKKQVECSRETYLHKLAKIVFYNIYKACLKKGKPFYLEYRNEQFCNHYKSKFDVLCNLNKETKSYDLTSYFTEIEIEKRDEGLIPDVKISNPKNNNSIYIEIAVTHESEENKKESGNRIIEFAVSDESDLKLFTSKTIALNKERITRYNFKKIKSTSDKCSGNCRSTHKVFQVFESGKSRLADITLQKLDEFIEHEAIIYHKIVDLDKFPYMPFSHIYTNKVIEAHENDIDVRNCFLCRYHSKNSNMYIYDPDPIFCKFLKKSCGSNEAVECEYYRADRSVYSEYKR